MTLRIHAVLHNDINVLGSIDQWIARHQHNLTQTQLYNGDVLPDIDSFDWLIIMGGPMGVYETEAYPWLVQEKAFVAKAIEAGKTIIGMCLGTQLIAEALGAKVSPIDVKEIGWTALKLTQSAQQHPLLKGIPSEFTTFQWHGDGFELPNGATLLASSEYWQNQGFIYQTDKHKELGTWLMGWQCHFEVRAKTLEGFIYEGTGITQKDIQQYPQTVQHPDLILENTEKFVDENNAYFDTMLDNLAFNYERKMKVSHAFSGALRTFAYFIASGTHYMLKDIEYMDLFGSEPSAIEMVFAIFTNVVEMNENGEVLNFTYAQKRATDYLKSYCSDYVVEPPFEEWEISLYSPPMPDS